MPFAPKTRRQQRKEVQRDRHKHTAHQRGYTRAYYKARRTWIDSTLAEHPEQVWCACCGKPAEVVDHIDPPAKHGQPGTRAYVEKHQDQDNWQLLCTRCNSVKGSRHMTAQELRREMGIDVSG